jgi:hypothetical protein
MFIILIIVCLQHNVYTQNLGKFVVVSDIHYAPEIGSNPPSPVDIQYGNDSPMWLVNSTVYAIGDAQLVAPNDFILLSGDLISHDLAYLPDDQAIVYANTTLSGLRDAFARVFGKSDNKFLISPVICLGNNDLYPKYPAPNSTSSWLSGIASAWPSITYDSVAKQSFLQSGAYSIDIPIPSTTPSIVRVISLHTNYWSSQNIYTTNDADPGGVFALLKAALKKAQTDGVKVYIIGHIAPGIDHHALTNLWQPRFVSTYMSIIQPYLGNIILGQFYGHEHIALFRLFAEPNTKFGGGNNNGGSGGGVLPAASAGPIRLHSSISPVYGNNPSFRQYTYDRDTLEVLDFSEWFLNFTDARNPVWTKQFSSAKSLYNLPNVDAYSYCAFVGNMYENQTLYNEFYINSYAFATDTPACDDICKSQLLCDVQFIYSDDYNACVSGDKMLQCSGPSPTTSGSSTSTSPTTSTPSATTTISTSTISGASTASSASSSSTTGHSPQKKGFDPKWSVYIVLPLAGAACAIGGGIYFYMRWKKSSAAKSYSMLTSSSS